MLRRNVLLIVKIMNGRTANRYSSEKLDGTRAPLSGQAATGLPMNSKKGITLRAHLQPIPLWFKTASFIINFSTAISRELES